MCGLCGAFGVGEHWADGLAGGSQAERQRRAAVANRVLGVYGLRLTPWGGRYTLAGPTGKSSVVDNFGALWIAAEKLTGRTLDPLDPALLERLDA